MLDVTPRAAASEPLIMERDFEEVNDATAEDEQRTIDNLKNQINELAKKVGVSIVV